MLEKSQWAWAFDAPARPSASLRDTLQNPEFREVAWGPASTDPTDLQGQGCLVSSVNDGGIANA
jgi:hypothetical protein